MAKRDNKQQQLDDDLETLNDAISAVMCVVRAKAPGEAHSTFVDALSGLQLKAIDRLVPLLERKAALLGLDAPMAKPATTETPSGSLAELEKKLALVKRC